LPNTEYVTDNEVTLPMYSSLTIDQIDYITTELQKAIA
jgi:dTDP-4-amino-4,6-dideoxygalactose transaminase